MRFVSSWRRKLKEEHVKIIENTGQIEPVMSSMLSSKGLTQQQYTDIECGVTFMEKLNKLLLVVRDGPDETVTSFVQALEKTDQGHVLDLITGCSSIMTHAHKELLIKHRLDLSQNLTALDELMCCLRSDNVLTSYDEEQTRAKYTTSGQAMFLLDILSKKPDGAFYYFIEALRMTTQPHLAGLLQNSEERDFVEEVKALWDCIKYKDEVIEENIQRMEREEKEMKVLKEKLDKCKIELEDLQTKYNKRGKENKSLKRHLVELSQEVLQGKPNVSLVQSYSNIKQELFATQTKLATYTKVALIMEATHAKVTNIQDFANLEMERPVVNLDVGSRHGNQGQLTDVVALPTGGALLVHKNINSGKSSAILEINQETQKLWYSSPDNMSVAGIIKGDKNIFVLHESGVIIKRSIDQNMSREMEQYHVDIEEFGQGTYVKDTNEEFLVLSDPQKGNISTFDLKSGKQNDVITNLNSPSSVTLDVSSGYRIYIVTEEAEHRVGLYDACWRLIQYIGTQGRMPGELDKPSACVSLPDGRFLVSEKGNNRVCQYDDHGFYTRTLLDSSSVSSPCSMSFSYPYLWVVCTEKNQAYNVKRFTIYN